MTRIRSGQVPAALTIAQFQERFLVRFHDPAFDGEREAVARLGAIACDAPVAAHEMRHRHHQRKESP